MAELTEAVERFLQTLIDLGRSNGRPPTFEELRVALGLRSDSSITSHAATLERLGYVERLSGSRGLRVLKYPDGRVYPGS